MSTSAMSEKYLRTVRKLIVTQAWREVAAAEVFADAVKHAPTLPDKKLVACQALEELTHYELCEALYRELGGDLWQEIQARIRRYPWPRVESWPELAIFQVLNDRAAKFQLLEYRECSYAPYAAIINRILDEEEGHVGFGESVVREMCTTDEARRREAQVLFDKWLPYCLVVFGRPGTPGDLYAVETGLKARDSASIMREYVEDLRPVMDACGLRFPPASRLGVEVPADLLPV